MVTSFLHSFLHGLTDCIVGFNFLIIFFACLLGNNRLYVCMILVGWGRICQFITFQGKLADYFYVNNCPNVNYESLLINLSRPLIVLELCPLLCLKCQGYDGSTEMEMSDVLMDNRFPKFFVK